MMSATSELILQELQEIEKKIQEANDAGLDDSLLLEQKSKVLKRFKAATEALNEGKQVLKG